MSRESRPPEPAPRSYRLHGLTVSSTLSLPARSTSASHADVRLELVAELPLRPRRAERIVDQGALGMVAYRDVSSGQVWSEFGAAARYVWGPLPTRCRVALSPSLARQTAELLLSSSVLSLIQALRGKLVLHASAVAMGSRLVAFAGPSGSGKTTFAALLCRLGGTLVTDDALVLEPSGSGWCAAPGTTQLRLREGSSLHAQGAQLTRSVDGRLCWVPELAPAQPTALTDIVLLRPEQNGGLRLSTLTPQEAFVPVLRALRTHGFTGVFEQKQQFEQVAALARTRDLHQLQYCPTQLGLGAATILLRALAIDFESRP